MNRSLLEMKVQRIQDLSLEAAERAIVRHILAATLNTPDAWSSHDWVREVAKRLLGDEAGFFA